MDLLVSELASLAPDQPHEQRRYWETFYQAVFELAETPPREGIDQSYLNLLDELGSMPGWDLKGAADLPMSQQVLGQIRGTKILTETKPQRGTVSV